MKLGINSPTIFSNITGITKVARVTALELSKLGIDIKLINTSISHYNGIVSREDFDTLVSFTKKEWEPEITLSITSGFSKINTGGINISYFLGTGNNIPDNLDFNGVTEIWVPSKHLQNILTKSKKVIKKNIHYLPFGVDTNTFSPGNRTITVSDELKTKYDFVYGYIGDYNTRKGIDILLTAHYDMFDKKDNVALLIKGDLLGAKYLLKDIQNLEFKGNLQPLNNTVPIKSKDNAPVVVYNFNSYREVELAAIYKSLDLFVFPSRGEWFGLTPLEVMCSGIPLICSNNTSMKDFDLENNSIPISSINDDIILEHYPDYLFSEPDYNQYNDLIQQVYQKKIDTKSLTDRAREFVVDNYDYSVVFPKMKERLETILGK